MPESENRKVPLRGKLSRALEFPTDAMGGISCISVTGCHEMTVYHCKCVVSYESDEVILCLCDGTVRIVGSKLEMKTFASGVIRLCGSIDRIEFGGMTHA